MLWKPTINPGDDKAIVQLKTLLREIVDAIHALRVVGDNVTTTIQAGVISALVPSPDWVKPYELEEGETYVAGLYHAKAWIGPAQMVNAITDQYDQYADVWARFVGPAPTTLTDGVVYQAVMHKEDVSAAQDGSTWEDVWVIAPLQAWGTGTYLAVIQDGGLVRLTAPATGTYFLGSVDGEIAWIEAGECS